MSLTNLDLFGHPLAPPSHPHAHSGRRRVPSQESKRAKLVRHLEQSSNLVLFDELLEYLKGPILDVVQLPAEFESDVPATVVVDDDIEEAVDDPASLAIPYEPWGTPWVIDRHDLRWSVAGLLFTQVRLFWRSLEELALSNNEQEKWSVLRWLHRPAIWKYYVYDKRIGRSHCLEVHERDEPFSFHNCCIAARMDEDKVREGVRRNIPAVVIKAVEKVCAFD